MATSGHPEPSAERTVHGIELAGISPAGWGPSYSVSEYDQPYGSRVLVAVSHLSRFTLFGRPGSATAAADVVTTIANRLADERAGSSIAG